MPIPRLRIVQIVETLAVGGLEMMAVNLAIAHRNAGHFSAIYTVFEPGTLAEQAITAGVPVISFHKKRGFSASAIWRIQQRLRADRAQIAHTHNSSIHHYGVIAGTLAGAAVVNTRHGLALHSAKRQEVYFKTVLPLTRAVAFVCDYGRRHYAAKGVAPADKSVVILTGIPVKDFQSFRASPGSVRPKLRFGTVGRLVRAKAHHDLLEAFAMLAGEMPEAELGIWGYGELQQELELQIAALGLTGRVRYHGPTAKSAAVFQELDVFVLSSISEGLPLVILEAMAAGLPVVSTRVGGISEVAPAGTMAWFAEPANPASLAEAMRKAAASDLAAAGAAAYEYANRHFSILNMQRSYEDLYRKVLGTSCGAGQTL